MTVLWSETGRAKHYAHCHFWDKSLRPHRRDSATCVENLQKTKMTSQQPKQNCQNALVKRVKIGTRKF